MDCNGDISHANNKDLLTPTQKLPLFCLDSVLAEAQVSSFILYSNNLTFYQLGTCEA